jgi:hypothetical protein
MHMLRVAVSVAGLVSTVSPHAQTQGLDTLTAAQRAGFALARLGAHQRVQIITRGDQFVEGSVVAASPNLVTLRTDGSERDIPAASVDSLWVKEGTHAGRGALIGAVPGVVSFAALLTCGGPASEARDLCYFGGVIRSVVLLGGGILAGALIGAGQPKWKLRVP